jgi:hypothetical protein
MNTLPWASSSSSSASIGRPAAAFYWTDANSSAMFFNSEPFPQGYVFEQGQAPNGNASNETARSRGTCSREGQEVLSQSKRPEVGRFLLQVDRQTKRSYATAEAAETAGMVIKKGHPIVRVSVYDSVETANKIIELPAGSPPTS